MHARNIPYNKNPHIYSVINITQEPSLDILYYIGNILSFTSLRTVSMHMIFHDIYDT